MSSLMHPSDRSKILMQSIRFLLGLVVLIVALSVMDPANDLRLTLTLYTPFALILLGMLAGVRRGHSRAISWGLLGMTNGLVALSVLFMGFSGHSGTAFTVCVMLAGALLGGRAAIQSAVGIILFCTIMLWLELAGRLPEPWFVSTPINSWIALCISLATIAVLFHHTLLSLKSAVNTADQNARERDEAMQRFLTTQKMELVGQLTSGVAHDFNNLLTVVSGSVAILEEDLPEDDIETRELLRDINAATARASLMTKRLLSFSRTSPTTLEPIDIARVLHELSPMLPRLLGTAITIQLRAPESTHILASRAGLEQILLNLAVNAREAMPVGGTLTFTVSTDATQVWLIAEDTGTGMDAETRSRIFNPFFTTKENGSGLGLATVSALVRQFSGTVAVDSTLGQGSWFTLSFPLAHDIEPVAMINRLTEDVDNAE
ncbi:MAG: signal transduction histidine kinase [Myxococcota bacterium]|jgi:signal transduction histidine kinase